MFENDYEEIPLPERAEVSGAPPLLGSERSAVRAFRGRFCFDFGLATKCLKTTVSLREGETHALKVSVGGEWGSISHDITYEMERTITYEVGECDSVTPVLMYDDSELQIHEVRRSFLGFSWRYNETHFIPGGRPVLCGNQTYDDQACGCASDRPPTGDPNDRVAVRNGDTPSRALRTSSFAADPGAPAPDPDEAVTHAAQVLDESVGDPQDVGIIGLDGEPAWVGREPAAGVRPILLSSDCNASLRGKILIAERDSHYPLLAVMPGNQAVEGMVTMYLDEHSESGLVRFLDQPARVLTNGFATVWAGIDFSDIRAGTSGMLELRLLDHHSDQLGEPLRQPFDVIEQPVAAAAQALVPAY